MAVKGHRLVVYKDYDREEPREVLCYVEGYVKNKGRMRYITRQCDPSIKLVINNPVDESKIVVTPMMFNVDYGIPDIKIVPTKWTSVKWWLLRNQTELSVLGMFLLLVFLATQVVSK